MTPSPDGFGAWQSVAQLAGADESSIDDIMIPDSKEKGVRETPRKERNSTAQVNKSQTRDPDALRPGAAPTARPGICEHPLPQSVEGYDCPLAPRGADSGRGIRGRGRPSETRESLRQPQGMCEMQQIDAGSIAEGAVDGQSVTAFVSRTPQSGSLWPRVWGSWVSSRRQHGVDSQLQRGPSAIRGQLAN